MTYKYSFTCKKLQNENALCRSCVQIGNKNAFGHKWTEKMRQQLSGDNASAKKQINKEKVRNAINNLYKNNPEYKKKISDGVKNYFKLHPESLQSRNRGFINQYVDKFTDIERKVAAILESYGISYQHNYPIGKYWADFLIFNNIVLECDGEYWHNDLKDREKDNYLESNNFKVYRFRGNTIRKNLEYVKNLICEIINKEKIK